MEGYEKYLPRNQGFICSYPPLGPVMHTGISLIPGGQRKAIESLVGGERAHTYVEASEVAGISVNTLYTHLRRVRRTHPKLYKAIYRRRRSQLRERHREAAARARDHTRQYFKRVRKWERWLLD